VSRDRRPRDEVLAEIAELEASIASAPDDEELRSEALHLHAELQQYDVRRSRHILWFAQNRPADPIAATPLASVDRAADPAGFDAVERAWSEAVTADPGDLARTRAFASFVSRVDPMRATSLVRSFVAAHPDDADAWFELGRASSDPRERLDAFLEAQRRGATQWLLGEFLARAALAADDLEVARATGEALLAKAASLRAEHGEAVEWTDRGGDFWERALAHTGNRKTARTLVNAHSTYANAAHNGHTALGIVAARACALDEAVIQLHQSVRVSEFRMSSYGPSFRLAAELLRLGRTKDVEAFLRQVRTFWEPETIDAMLDDLAHDRVPTFPDH
jgi:hypothetical protein